MTSLSHWRAPLLGIALSSLALACGSQEDKPTTPERPAAPSGSDPAPTPTAERPSTEQEAKQASARTEKPSAQPTTTDGARLPEEQGLPVSEPPKEPEVKRLVIASAVQDREPKPLEAARVEEPITAFIELANDQKTNESVIVTFQHESGEKVGFIELAVPAGSPRYRTWGRTHNIKQPGKWTAIVSSKNGKELAREDFDILAPESKDP